MMYIVLASDGGSWEFVFGTNSRKKAVTEFHKVRKDRRYVKLLVATQLYEQNDETNETHKVLVGGVP